MSNIRDTHGMGFSGLETRDWLDAHKETGGGVKMHAVKTVCGAVRFFFANLVGKAVSGKDHEGNFVWCDKEAFREFLVRNQVSEENQVVVPKRLNEIFEHMTHEYAEEVNDFKTEFLKKHGKDPTDEQIRNHMQEKDVRRKLLSYAKSRVQQAVQEPTARVDRYGRLGEIHTLRPAALENVVKLLRLGGVPLTMETEKNFEGGYTTSLVREGGPFLQELEVTTRGELRIDMAEFFDQCVDAFVEGPKTVEDVGEAMGKLGKARDWLSEARNLPEDFQEDLISVFDLIHNKALERFKEKFPDIPERQPEGKIEEEDMGDLSDEIVRIAQEMREDEKIPPPERQVEQQPVGGPGEVPPKIEEQISVPVGKEPPEEGQIPVPLEEKSSEILHDEMIGELKDVLAKKLKPKEEELVETKFEPNQQRELGEALKGEMDAISSSIEAGTTKRSDLRQQPYRDMKPTDDTAGEIVNRCLPEQYEGTNAPISPKEVILLLLYLMNTGRRGRAGLTAHGNNAIILLNERLDDPTKKMVREFMRNLDKTDKAKPRQNWKEFDSILKELQ